MLRKQVQGTARARHQLFLLHRRASARSTWPSWASARVDEMVGRVDMLEVEPAVDHWKARGLDFSAILYNPPVPARVARRCVQAQDHGLEKALDHQLDCQCARLAIEIADADRSISLPIRNVHRSVGTMLSGEIARRYGSDGPARRHHPHSLQRLGRAELRRISRQRRHAHARRRGQRLRRQRTFRRHV